MHLSSNREASKSRDYIFATMPQFLWYHYPQDAVNMQFGDIFIDFYNQSASAGHGFSSLITRSMVESNTVYDGEDAWKPGLDQPEPKCLGDFLKLLGQPLQSMSTSNTTTELAQNLTASIHVTALVSVEDLPRLGGDLVILSKKQFCFLQPLGERATSVESFPNTDPGRKPLGQS